MLLWCNIQGKWWQMEWKTYTGYPVYISLTTKTEHSTPKNTEQFHNSQRNTIYRQEKD